MTKQDVVAELVRRLKLPKLRCAALVDGLFGRDGIIAGELRRGGSVQISGFGVFETRRRRERRGRNPRTGKEIRLKASIAPAFRPGSALKAAVARKR